jgi:hypothetical protein
MKRRSAVTLMEVLIAMFIMAIGMLALLALFPVGAVSMAQALKDDRCASTAAMGENIAIATNIRHDTNVKPGFFTSSVVYVDPYGFQQGLTVLGITTIPRVAPSFALTPQLADRFFTLPDDITFLDAGVPDTSSGFIDRGRHYSYAYLLRQLPMSNLVQLFVVVYNSRPTGVVALETTDVAATVTSTNSIQLSLAATTIKRGGWILDTTGNFYRVTNIVEGGTPMLETQQSFPATAVGTTVPIVIMDYVAEVFDKGTGWQP